MDMVAVAAAAAKESRLETGLLLPIDGSQIPSPAQAPPKRSSCRLNFRLQIDVALARTKVLPVAWSNSRQRTSGTGFGKSYTKFLKKSKLKIATKTRFLVRFLIHCKKF